MTDATAQSSFEPRRYSAVMLADERFDTAAEVCDALKIAKHSLKQTDYGQLHWQTFRFEYEHEKNMYPESSRHKQLSATSSGFLYEFFIAFKAGKRQAPTPIIVASPYIRILAKSLEEVARSTSGGAPIYVRPDMDALFKHFEGHFYPQLSTTRITVQVDDDQGVDFVDLAGRNPLRSGLRQALDDSDAAPYGLRINGKYTDRRRGTNVNVDRHGNLYWHSRTPESFLNVLALANILWDTGIMQTTTDAPWKRVPMDGT